METNRDDLGLSIDMLDADRLRYWLGVIEDAIGDVEDDPTRTVPTLSNLPDRLEEAVRDIGTLREQVREKPTLTDAQILQMLDEVYTRMLDLKFTQPQAEWDQESIATVRAFLTQAGVLR